jgi:hypothetical protein
VSLLSRKDDDPTDYALSVLAQMADRLRIPTEPSHLVTVVGAMLDGITVVSKDVAGSDLIVHWSDPERLARELRDRSFDELLIESLQAHQTQLLETLREYQDLTDRIRSKNGHDIGSIDHSFHSFLWKWFERKLIVIEDYYATGEQIVQTICSCTPPGFHNRIMGIQNIKGTGLDFVYRWQAWGKCYEGCRLLRSGDREEFGRGLRLLADFREFGLLSVEHVEESLALARQSPLAAREQVVTQLDKIQFNLNAALSRLRQELKGSRKRGRVAGLLSLAEQFVDATDAVRRRKTADQIYKDLTTERISVERAAQELQKLNKRQKGGWLAQSLAKSPADRDA